MNALDREIIKLYPKFNGYNNRLLKEIDRVRNHPVSPFVIEHNKRFQAYLDSMRSYVMNNV